MTQFTSLAYLGLCYQFGRRLFAGLQWYEHYSLGTHGILLNVHLSRKSSHAYTTSRHFFFPFSFLNIAYQLLDLNRHLYIQLSANTFGTVARTPPTHGKSASKLMAQTQVGWECDPHSLFLSHNATGPVQPLGLHYGGR